MIGRSLEEAVRKVEAVNQRDLNRFVHGKTGIVAEQFIDGPEFAIETLSIQGNVHVLSIGYKGNSKGPFFEEGVYIAPAQLKEETRLAIVKEVTGAVSALGIHQGPAHTEPEAGQGWNTLCYRGGRQNRRFRGFPLHRQREHRHQLYAACLAKCIKAAGEQRV